MNMVRIVFNKKILMAALVLISTLGAVRYALSPAQAVVFCDQRLAPDVQTAIKKFIAQAPLRLQAADSLCKELQKSWPAVRSVDFVYKSSLRAQIAIKAYVPFLKISASEPGHKEYILCKYGQPERAIVIDKKYFNAYSTESMPTVFIDGPDFEKKRKQADCIKCLRDLKEDLCDEYTITWRSKSEIIMRACDAPIMLVADRVTVHEAEQRRYVRRIFAADAGKYKGGIRADIRLRDSIVCAPLKERAI